MGLTVEQEKAIAIAKARLRVQQSQQSAAATNVQDTEEVPAKPQSALDKTRGGLQSYLKGALFGFGDEIVGAGRAALSSLDSDYDFGSDVRPNRESISDAYAKYRNDERDVTRQFEDENQGTALGLNLVGGILSPANAIAPGSAVQGGGRALPTAMQVLTRGTAEGALQGYGEGEGSLEDQLKSAATGGAFGFGASGLLGGAGRVLRGSTKRRIAEDIVDEDGVIKPLNLADPEGRLGKFYRNTVSNAWGSKIGEQESTYLKKALAAMGIDTSTMSDATKGTAADLAEVGRGISSTASSLKQGLDDRLDDAADAVRMRLQAESGAKASEIAGDAARFRALAAKESLPEELQPILSDIDMNDMQKVSSTLKNFWNNDAFGVVKNRKFDWEGDVDGRLVNSIKGVLSEDPGLAIEASGAIGKINGLVSKLKAAGLPANKDMAPMDLMELILNSKKDAGIDGSALMEIRNVFAKAANKPSSGRSPRAIATQIDNFMRNQMDDVDVGRFNEELGRYKNYLTFRSAAKKAADNDGLFDPRQYRKASEAFGDITTGDVPLNETSQAARAKQRALEKSIKKAREDAAEEIRREKRTARRTKRDVSNEAKQKEDTLRQMSRGVSPENSNTGSQAVSTALLGMPLAFATGGLLNAIGGAIPAGYATAKALSTPLAQKTLAGQTAGQEAIARLLRGLDEDQLLTRAGQGLTRFGAGQVTGE